MTLPSGARTKNRRTPPRLVGERVHDFVAAALRLGVGLVDVGADVHRDDRVVREVASPVTSWMCARPSGVS
jgi:hypothetical protein